MVNQKSDDGFDFNSIEEVPCPGVSDDPFFMEQSVTRYVRKTLFEMHKSVNFGTSLPKMHELNEMNILDEPRTLSLLDLKHPNSIEGGAHFQEKKGRDDSLDNMLELDLDDAE
jgi:hypothetical protein